MDLRYPIGKPQLDEKITEETIRCYIGKIRELPSRLRDAVAGLNNDQLDTPYRPEGWTVRQVVHHLADSHMISFVRFKLALTEESPAVNAYSEVLWAGTADAATAPIESSLELIEGLHQRWTILLESTAPPDFARTFVHPKRGVFPLDRNLAIYAWHGAHHVAHITCLRARMGW